MTRRTHAALAEVGLITVIAWTIALGMLAHATDSGPHQWADWGVAGTFVALLLLIVVGGGLWLDAALHNRRHRRRENALRRMPRRAEVAERPTRAATTAAEPLPAVDPVVAKRDRGLVERGRAGDDLADIVEPGVDRWYPTDAMPGAPAEDEDGLLGDGWAAQLAAATSRRAAV
jgi:hypothetical protein